jgi:hypothetical protein
LIVDATPPDDCVMTNTLQTDDWPNITELLDQAGGHISIGRMPPIEGAAIAVNDQALVAGLVRRESETGSVQVGAIRVTRLPSAFLASTPTTAQSLSYNTAN